MKKIKFLLFLFMSFNMNLFSQNNTQNENLSLSYILEKEGKYKEAIDLLLKKENFNDEDYAQLGKCHYYLKNYKKAIEYYNKAIEANPKKSIYYNNLAYILKYDDTMGSIDKQLFNINKAIYLEPNKASYYVTRANIETDMKGLKMNEENRQAIRKILLAAYKSDFNDFSKSIELEPNNLKFRENRISLYSPLWDEDLYNNDENMIFDIREFIVEDYIKIIELTTDDKKSLSQRQKLAELYEKLSKNNINYANLALAEFKKIYSIDKNENYNNDFLISLLFQKLKKHSEAIQYFTEIIDQEKKENKKNLLNITLGEYYLWLSENNTDKKNNFNNAFIEFNKVINNIDNKLLKSPNSLKLLAERVTYTKDIAQKKYFDKGIEAMDKIKKKYDSDKTECEVLSFAYYSVIFSDKSKSYNCYNQAKKEIESLVKGRELEKILKLVGVEKENFIEYYKKVKNIN